MAEKTINTRIVLRNDSLANWQKSSKVLLQGEVALAKRTDGSFEVRVGDGTKTWSQLSATGFGHTDYYAKSTFEELSAITDAPNGSVGVVTEEIAGGTSKTAYTFNAIEKRWEAMDGNYSAENVYFQDDITCAGDYTRVGNVTKTSNATTSTLTAKGKSLADIMTKIFTQEIAGTKTKDPSASGAWLKGKVNGAGDLVTAAKSYEYGTFLTDLEFGGGVFNKGTYSYGPTSQQTAASWATTATNGVTVATGAASNAGTLDTVVIGDQGADADNDLIKDYKTVASVQVTETATYATDTVSAYTNLGKDDSPRYNHDMDPVVADVVIPGGTKSTASGIFSGYRKPFWGYVLASETQLAAGALTSANVRSLRNSGTSAAGLPATYVVPAGTKQIFFAAKAGTKSSITVNDANALNAPVSFTKKASGVKVEGANGYTAVAYDYWFCELDSATGAGKAMDLRITWA